MDPLSTSDLLSPEFRPTRYKSGRLGRAGPEPGQAPGRQSVKRHRLCACLLLELCRHKGHRAKVSINNGSSQCVFVHSLTTGISAFGVQGEYPRCFLCIYTTSPDVRSKRRFGAPLHPWSEGRTLPGDGGIRPEGAHRQSSHTWPIGSSPLKRGGRSAAVRDGLVPPSASQKARHGTSARSLNGCPVCLSGTGPPGRATSAPPPLV
ncbi:hypothetical protein MRX96_025011 [Rhipicephalus microplus]